MKTRVAVRPGTDVTLPLEIMSAAGIAAGDIVTLVTTEPGSVEILMSTAATTQADQTNGVSAGETTEAFDYDRLPNLTVDEFLGRFRINGPVDFAALREAIHNDMAKDVFGERPDRLPS